ncbi:unnamed protein product [Echinostoma caproni]|uniref:Ig-like domain-containing protein n=1 Tax=Echinostoma caproni TaxID=27848 RepID=A0A183AGB9_9TREM|nr:unnamed protein product [Echinostoma caproni]
MFRLHERIWPNLRGVSEELVSVLHSRIKSKSADGSSTSLYDVNFEEEKRTTGKRKKNITYELVSAPRLYIFVAKPNEPGYVLTTSHGRFSKGRTQLIKDKLVIKRTRVEDTGMYYCYYEGRKIREWAVTVVSGHDEPFRNVPQPIEFEQTVLEKLRDQNDGDNRTLVDELLSGTPSLINSVRPLNSKKLLKNNLEIRSEWSSWTECVPCTPLDQLPRSPEPGGDGFQMRVGTCRVSLLDPFHRVKPHELSLQIDELLRVHARRGLPCRSHLIRDAMRLYGPKALIIRPNEIMLRECIRTCPMVKKTKTKFYKLPKRVQLRVNEGENLVISCPVRGAILGPISWFYAPLDMDELVNLTTTAFMSDTIKLYGSPPIFLTTVLSPVHVVSLFDSTRGRYRVDTAYNLIVAEAIAKPSEDEIRLNHLICIHGDARTTNDSELSEWAGIVDVEVVPRAYSVVMMSKLSQVVLLLIPFALAVGTFVVIAITMQTERKPNMRAAADGFTSKPPP